MVKLNFHVGFYSKILCAFDQKYECDGNLVEASEASSLSFSKETLKSNRIQVKNLRSLWLEDFMKIYLRMFPP